MFSFFYKQGFIKNDFNLGEDVNLSTIRLNLQSPGKIEFKQVGRALILASFIFVSYSCRENETYQTNDPDISSFKDQNEELLKEIDDKFEILSHIDEIKRFTRSFLWIGGIMALIGIIKWVYDYQKRLHKSLE